MKRDCHCVSPQTAGPSLVSATTAAVSSVLLSPSVFQQTVPRSTDLERKASSPSPLTVGTPENQRKPSIILSKSQLQDTLIHLIKVCRISASFLISYLNKAWYILVQIQKPAWHSLCPGLSYCWSSGRKPGLPCDCLWGQVIWGISYTSQLCVFLRCYHGSEF